MYRLTANEGIIEIIEGGSFFGQGSSKWTEYELWLSRGNIPEPMELQKAKDELAERMRIKCQSAIEELYPIWKQINILNGLVNQSTSQPYTEQEKADMFTHIESQRAKCLAKEQQIAQAQTVEQVQAISWG